MTVQYIDKASSDTDNEDIFYDINSSSDLWNFSDDNVETSPVYYVLYSMKGIKTEPQYMTDKYSKVWWLNGSRKYIMYLIDLSSCFYENHYNIR